MSTHTSTVNFVDIPAELKSSCRFCTWKMERGAKSSRLTKVPYKPGTNRKAQTNNPDTFSDFTDAMKAYAMGGYDGIGIRVASGIGAIDIDHCIREDGTLNDVAASVLGIFKDAYFERSPSGSGLRGFFQVDADYIFDKTVYYINNRTHGLEVYLPGATNRFVTVTGDQYRPGSVPHDMAALQTVLDTFMKRKSQVTNSHIEPCSYLSDEQVLEHAKASANGERFMDYYNGDWQKYFDNQSDADMGFVSMLCFWCGCDEEQIDRIFRSSGMMRPKWDRRQAGTTYGAITIRNAIASCQTIYLPVNAQDMVDARYDFSSLDTEGDGPDNDKTLKKADFEADLSRITLTIEEMQPHTNPRYGKDEIGIGYAFADYFKPIARYNAERKMWYVYDGIVWQPDIGGLKIAELGKLLADKLYVFAITIREEDVRKRFIDRVKKLQQRKHRETMIKDAMSVYPINMKYFDRDIYLFNCQNGTLDLRTMEFREHRPEEFLTKVSPVVYDPEAVCPRWLSFMDEVMQGDTSRSRYLQKALGYSLSGDTRMECMFILYGATSRNGKGTTMESVLRILGEYGKNADPSLLSTKFGVQSSGGPSEEIARLAGSRFVNISEPEKKITLDAALTKRLTGNDTITARYLHENSFEFRPNFKVFINTNHLPNITDLTLFESGRIKIIPFNRHFDEAEQDKGLKALFAKPDNMSGIFNWLLEGWKLFEAEKLDMPQSVIDATAEYNRESDRVAQFVTTCLVEKEDGELANKAVFTRYQEWCRDNGYRPENIQHFTKALSRHCRIERKRPKAGGNKKTLVFGYEFAADEEPEVDFIPDEEPGSSGDSDAVRT